MNKISLLVLLLLLLGALVLFGLVGSQDGGVGIEGMVGGPQPEESIVVSPVAGEATAREASAEPEGEGLAALEREQVANPNAAERTFVLQVWDGVEGVPASGAEVCFLRDPADSLTERFRGLHVGEMAESHGLRFRTESDGRLTLPRVQDWGVVTAQRPGFFAARKLSPRRGEVTLVLERDETLTVACVASGGGPAVGVEVGIVQTVPYRIDETRRAQVRGQLTQLETAQQQIAQFMERNPKQREKTKEQLDRIAARQTQIREQMRRVERGSNKNWRAPRGATGKAAIEPKFSFATREELRIRQTSGSDGRAVFRHFQLHRRTALEWWRPGDRGQCEAVLMMPLSSRQSAGFRGDPVPEDPVELRVPPTGVVVLRTVDENGKPFTHPVRGRLNVTESSPPRWSQRNIRKEQDATEIEFPFVGLGLEFVAKCRLDDEDFRWTTPPFAGPTEPGERLVVDLVVAPGSSMLSGRLVGEGGKPLRGIRSTFLINSRIGRLEGEEIITDQAGRFHLPFQPQKRHQPPFRLEIRQQNVIPVAGWVAPLASLPERKVTDLGDLEIRAFGAVARGVVVDDEGTPIPNARLQLQRQRDFGRDKPKPRFVDEAFVNAATDAEGRFELFADLESGHYRLAVEAGEHFDVHLDDLRPSADLRVVLNRRTKLVGSLLLPEWIQGDAVRVELSRVEGQAKPKSDRVRDYRGKRYIYYDWAPPGVYNVALRLRGFPDPILRIDGLTLAAGTTGLHPRLTDLDLRNALFRFEIEAVDGFGQRLQPDWPLVATIVRPDGNADAVGFRWQEKRVEVISASPQLEVWALANGYQGVRSTVSPGRSQLQFLKIPPVELNLSGLRQAVGEGLVWIKLYQEEGESRIPASLTAWDGASRGLRGWFGGLKRRIHGGLLSPRGSVRIPILYDGKFRVLAYLLSTGSERTARPQVVELGPLELRVQPGGDPVRRSLAVDGQKVEKARQRLAAAEAAAAKKR